MKALVPAIISGWGVVSACGSGSWSFESALYGGKSGISLKVLSDPDFGQAVLVGFIDEFEAPAIISTPRPDRNMRLAVAAALEAISSAKLSPQLLRGYRTGIYIGCTQGGAGSAEEGYKTFYKDGRTRLWPTTGPTVVTSAIAAEFSIRWGICGPQMTYSMACASAATAIGEAYRAVATGQVDIAIAGGTESTLSPATIMAWRAMGVYAISGDDPSHCSRPFSSDRCGMVLAEGSAFLIIESEDHLIKRRGTPRARISGYGMASEAKSLTNPCIEGQIHAMDAALEDARISASSLGYINAHATGTKDGDDIEAKSIAIVLGENVTGVPISSTKSLHGHTLGAAGAVEAIAALIALKRRTAIPSYFVHPDSHKLPIRLAGADPFLPNQWAVMSNSFGFGGINVSLVFEELM